MAKEDDPPVEDVDYEEGEAPDPTADTLPGIDPSGEPMEVALPDAQVGDRMAEAGYIDGEPPAEVEELEELDVVDDDA